MHRPTPPLSAPHKTCGCGRSYSLAEWLLLPLKGNWTDEADEEGPAQTFELRNCPCGSSIAVVVPFPPPAPTRSAALAWVMFGGAS